ncbi:MAG TPA: cytochrome P450 [Acidimicrobiales bacterium]|nr:cytochrome P450 [Acidimicrobiales bacterium]
MTTGAPPIDLLSPASFAGGPPHEQFRWLRENDPVHWHDEPDGPGFWAVTTHAEVRRVGREPATFSSVPTTMITDQAAMDLGGHQMMLMMDPPRHNHYRRLVIPDFIPKAARALQPRIRALATRIVDGVAAEGACDLVEDVAGLMPSYVIAEMLGIPLADGVELYRLTEAIHAAPESQSPGAGMAAVLAMFNYAHQVWEEKRRRPADDLASRLAHSEVEGHPLDEVDFNLFFLLLVDAGGDTTRNLVATGLHALLEEPEQLQRLRTDLDALMPTAIEELLRWVSPVVYMRRTATTDTSLGGRTIAAGDKVVMYYGSANRDAAVFDEPDRLDVGRRPNDHVAFGGGGPHFCLGAHIGRMEIEAMLGEVLTRLPDLEVAGEPEWLQSNFISGLKHLPVRFSPQAKS